MTPGEQAAVNDTYNRVLDILSKLHGDLESEHHNLPGSLFLGKPTSRHHQIVGASRALVDLNGKICADWMKQIK